MEIISDAILIHSRYRHRENNFRRNLHEDHLASRTIIRLGDDFRLLVDLFWKGFGLAHETILPVSYRRLDGRKRAL